MIKLNAFYSKTKNVQDIFQTLLKRSELWDLESSSESDFSFDTEPNLTKNPPHQSCIKIWLGLNPAGYLLSITKVFMKIITASWALGNSLSLYNMNRCALEFLYGGGSYLTK